MNDRLKGDKNRLGNIENLLVQVVNNIQQLFFAVKHSAETTKKQVEINGRNLRLLVEANHRNTTMPATSFQNALATIGSRFDNLENCFERLENK